ncbi:RNA polymerase subunit sigma-24 [Aeromicrobium sp. Root236]|uniref:RNA polymerase sigma factor SigJ n=1 Tax=Aeromicrobium sp. Root236 TaxID=1736498 RepID=UPI00070162EC|nr:RNA polymerase sigma factor SigJ [Aeromicrobium sp. Root236]KRC67084.1 RNA polymerase subunit sigma-24 [Aeromicrobium sp. Root236]
MSTQSRLQGDDSGLEAVLDERARLTKLAYRMLGSLAEAEDVVQETCARWYTLTRAERDDIDSPGAWLTTVASRISLDVLKSARARRESYVGEWIPEPLPDRVEWSDRSSSITVDPVDRISLDESVDMAFMVLLDTMTPAERVAFLLHDVFRYSFSEVAEVVGRTPAACRQLAASGRRRIREAGPVTAPSAHTAGIVRQFKRAWVSKDIAALIQLLDPAATVIADGGGVVPASLQPIVGAEAIARYLIDLATRAGAITLLERTVNGQPGLVGTHEGVAATVFAFDVQDGRIQRVWGVRNPAKLRMWR